jgi:hypothetical protein
LQQKQQTIFIQLTAQNSSKHFPPEAGEREGGLLCQVNSYRGLNWLNLFYNISNLHFNNI